MRKLLLAAAVFLIATPALAEESQSVGTVKWCFDAFPKFSQRDLQEACILKAVGDAAKRGQVKGDERAALEKERPRLRRERDVSEIVSDLEEFEADHRSRKAVNDAIGYVSFCSGVWANDPWMASRCVNRLSP